MAWTPGDIPDQRDRIAVVTGANAGLGAQTARELARKGALVIMAARTMSTAEQVRARIEAEITGAKLEIRSLDLASLESVRACGDGIVADHGRVDVLVNNAGVMGITEQATADGFEMQLGVNHLGHFVLTQRLLPALLAAPTSRVVSVTSFARMFGRAVDPRNPHLHGAYSPWRAYNQAKLANALFAVELHRRLAATGASVRSLLAHPGLAHTELQDRSVADAGGLSQRFWRFAARAAGMPPGRAAHSQLRAATDPGARGGEFYGPMWTSFGPPVRRPLLGRSGDREAARVLWEVSERETGERFDIR